MASRRRGPVTTAATVSILSVMAVTLAACGSSSGGGASSGDQPVQGGTLKLLGSSDVDHLDTASAYYTASYTLVRAFTRQLFSYPATTDTTAANTPVADLASELPTKDNGGISADGKTYTIHLRTGVKWNTTPARDVTAQDAVLGLKRLCNPVSPVGAPGYYENTIVGMTAYCDGFAKVPGTASAIAAYVNGHDISGVRATDDHTLVFTLTQPASDFVNILAMPFASPVPKEYLNYVPDDATFRQHTISDGPYQIVKYKANQEIDLDRNPAWDQSTDPLRHQYVDHITVTMGQDAGPVQQQIQAGTADLEWDTVVPTANIPALQAAKDDRLGLYPALDTNPYLLFNLQSPTSNSALKNVKVRQAIEYAIDKVAIGQVYGGPAVNTPLGQVIPPGNVGYQQFDPYATADSKGDPGKCKQMLADAGYPNGITIKDVYRNAGNHPAVAQAVQADLKKCGITDKLIPVNQGDYYGKYLNSPDAARRGVWDITEPGWVPDWYGNNGRAIIEPLFDGRHYGPNSVDYGDYDNPAVNALIDKALSAPDQDTAATYWHQADEQIMNDAAIVPFQTQKTALFRSSRVHNAIFWPFAQAYDVTQIWLQP
ncbi:ABC transporter substrate-binding protein [Phytohabitans rumicis]|uniref:ABC transporter substrate-binding protein n=2 Tax=Phytohabitans rumicis TaxID=1076125 RepID=A0A6V8LL70_9ACTN|nr:ABC transporter substrate-binding protein [Phytohabitans rumicis]